VTLTDHAEGRDSTRLKARHGGKGRPFLEAFHGDDYHRDSGGWRQVSRVVDREHGRYTERIVDERGHIVREVDEPLQHHTGRGAANHMAPKHSGT